MRLFEFVSARVAEDIDGAQTTREAREARAKAEMLASYSEAEFCELDAWSEALAILAAIWRDHPDYLDGWAT